MTETVPLKLRTRKLYQVRHHPGVFGRQVGFKARLVPLKAARRIANRLRRSGLDITIDPLVVKLTPEQVNYLERRYR